MTNLLNFVVINLNFAENGKYFRQGVDKLCRSVL
jgi:hypothetical protein